MADHPEPTPRLEDVCADDLLLDQVATNRRPSGGSDGEIVELLTEWRRRINSRALPGLLPVGLAVEAIRAGRRRQRSRRDWLIAAVVAGAGLMAVMGLIWLDVMSAHAVPGDVLYPLRQFFHGAASLPGRP